MTRQELYKKYVQLLNGIDLPELIEQKFLIAMKSGALNFEQEEDNSFRLPQIILHAALSDLADKFKPANPESLIESENLQRFL